MRQVQQRRSLSAQYEQPETDNWIPPPRALSSVRTDIKGCEREADIPHRSSRPSYPQPTCRGPKAYLTDDIQEPSAVIMQDVQGEILI